MAMTPEQADALPQWTTAQELAHVRHHIRLLIEQGEEGGVSDRRMRRAALDKLEAREQRHEQRLADEQAGDAGGGNVIVNF